MRWRLSIAALAVLALLTGCARMPSEDVRVRAVLEHELVGDGTTVAFDARQSVGRNLGYHYDFRDGTTQWGGSVVRYTYDEPGRYVVILTVVEGEADRWQPLAAPMARGPGEGTDAPSPDEVRDSTFAIVDLLQDGVQAAILPLRNNKPATVFWAWDAPTFFGGHSKTDAQDGMWHLWTAERRYRERLWEDGGWVEKWTDWHVPEGKEDRHRYQGESWEPDSFFRIPAGSKVVDNSVQYRITLKAVDSYGREDTASVIVSVHWC